MQKKSAEIWTINVKCANHEARSTQISVICHKTGVWRTCHQGCQATTLLQGLKTASHWFGWGTINIGIFAQIRGAIIEGVSISQSVSYTSGSDVLDLMNCLEKLLEFHSSLPRIFMFLSCLVCSNDMFRFNVHVRCCYATTSGQQKHSCIKDGGRGGGWTDKDQKRCRKEAQKCRLCVSFEFKTT